jgi:hypothetical protein
MYRKLSGAPGGKAAFTKATCVKAPYFGSIDPVIEELRSGRLARPDPRVWRALELPVAVNVLDPGDETVMRAEITMHVSEKAPPE